MPRARTLLVGYVSRPFGLARVTQALANQLAERREVHVLALDSDQPDAAASVPPSRGAWTLHLNRDPADLFAEWALENLVAKLRPRSVVLYHDPWYVIRLLRSVTRARTAVVAYCPLDGEIARDDIARGLRRLDGLAVPTGFARAAMLEAARRCGIEEARPFDSIAVLPHGNDTRTFGPRCGEPSDYRQRRVRARQRLFPHEPHRWSGFWVVNANASSERKQLDTTLRGFAGFAATAPDARLYLHWGAANGDARLVGMAHRMGIADRVVFGPAASDTSAERLNLVYNAGDVGVNTSIGEGWGLVAFEHAATSAPQIVPDHTACSELWRGSAILLPAARKTTANGLTTGWSVDAPALTGALTQLHQRPALYAALARRALMRASDPSFDWRRVGTAWEDWLRDVEARRRLRDR